MYNKEEMDEASPRSSCDQSLQTKFHSPRAELWENYYKTSQEEQIEKGASAERKNSRMTLFTNSDILISVTQHSMSKVGV